MKCSKTLIKGLATAGLVVAATVPSYAGPFILAGTDADDHGFVDAGGNKEGWLFMQRALENLAPGVTNGKKTIVTLGSSTGGALEAANSAFGLSILVGAGWTVVNIDGAAALTSFFDGSAAFNSSNAGILMMDSSGNVGGGATGAELAVFTAFAGTINSFLGGGGGLFSQSNGYGWVSALVPGLTVPGESNTGITLTPAGTAAFPGLTNADLSAGPYHNAFGNVGTLPVLGIGAASRNPIILGAAGGTITDPTPTVPDAGSFLPVYLGLAGLAGAFRRQKSAQLA